MLNLRYFDDCTPLVRAAWKFSGNLSRCVVCGQVSIANYKKNGLGEELNSEDRFLLEKTCNELNNLNLCIRQLGALEIHLTGGMCAPCVRDKMIKVARNRQIKQGFSPCFGTAIDGFCSQKDCKYYSCCVLDGKTLSSWQKRISRTCDPNCALKEEFNCDPVVSAPAVMQ